MDMDKPKSNLFFLSACVFFISIISKTIQYTLLPDKYFNDSNRILNMMRGNLSFALQKSYETTAILSKAINIFNFSSLLEWSIFYAIIFNLVIIIILRYFQLVRITDYIWVFASVGLLNLYVFNLSKDILQLSLFLIVYIIISLNASSTKKIVLSVLLLFAWGILYRIYYILIAAYSVLAYLSITYIKKGKGKSFVLLFVVAIAGVFTSLLFAKLFMVDEYNEIINLHYRLNFRREGSENALTMINDVFDANENIFIYILNYLINLLRMMLPFELLLKAELKYILFFAYQMLITIFIVRGLRRILSGKSTKEQLVACSLYIGFLLGSALFEPDFGSWIRHESAAIPVLLLSFFELKDIKSKRKMISSRYIRNSGKLRLNKDLEFQSR